MVTFNVDNVARGTMPDMGEWFDSKKNLANMVGIGLEATSVKDALTFGTHNFLAAINTAYDNHLPLTISPDMLWLVIAQGLSQHVNNNAEELRHQFVSHEGKETIIVVENDFVKGSQDNDWQHCFGQFSREIEKYIGKKRDLIVGNYTTTGPIEKAAHEIVLMESMQKYFDYECHTMCGIPQVTLLGTTEDWTNILNRVRAMSEFNLGWWTKELEPIVQEFVNASKGNASKIFWQNTYKESNESGGPYLSGWVVNLFSYLKDYKTGDFTLKNEFTKAKGHFSGPTTSSFPIGMSKVPFIWDYYGTRIDMELAAGFTGVAQDASGSVAPQIGWAVRDAESMVMATATFETKEKYSKECEALRASYIKQFKALGWEERSGWGNVITGVFTKENYQAAQEIGGLTWTKK